MQSQASTVDQYLNELPPERQEAVAQLRRVFKRSLPKGFVEQMQYGMIGYVVPHTLYPAGYHCDARQPLPFLGLASQKQHISVYHMGVYADADLLAWFKAAHAKASPQKLDMGKACIRYKKPEHIPHELLGELASRMTPAQWIALYEKSVRTNASVKR
jgi:Domain of unknown function (DU1801)